MRFVKKSLKDIQKIEIQKELVQTQNIQKRIKDVSHFFTVELSNKGEAKIQGTVPFMVRSFYVCFLKPFNFDLHKAPEVLKSGEYSFASDVYAFSILMWAVAFRSKPFFGFSVNQIATVVQLGTRPSLDEATCPPSLKELMARCWQADAQKRSTEN